MKYAVLDLETTGHSALDEILQIGLVIVSDEMEIIDTFNTFVKPNVEIPPFITQLTGIEYAHVQDAPNLDEALLELIPKLEDAVLVAHNVGFDANFLNHALDSCGYLPFNGRRLDTVELLRILYPTLSSYQLGTVADIFGVQHDHHHRADSDAYATALIFMESVKKLRSMPLLTVQRLSSFIDDSRDLGWFLRYNEQWMSERSVLESTEYDYYRQFALKAEQWTEMKGPRDHLDHTPFIADGKSFDEYLEEVKKRFQQIYDEYEEREAQTQMFQEVFQSLTNDSHLLIEAGTGTGKSLGYLIPSIYYGLQTEKKIVVSTHTINLQEQLKQRDLPLLGQVLPFPFKASLLKGRSNYLCMRKYETKINLLDFTAAIDDPITAAQMLVWLTETLTGDQEELNLGNKGVDFWDTVSSDADSCLNRACPWFKRCYYHRAKHEANIADVCITNHSMVFTDIQAEHRLLPSYQQLILDEAHHIEEVAAKHLGNQLSYFSFIQMMNLLYKDSKTGTLPALKMKIQQEGDDHAQSWIETIEQASPALSAIKDYWDKLFEWLYAIVTANINDSLQDQNGSMVYRINIEQLPTEWEEAVKIEQSVHIELNRFAKSLEKMSADIKERLDEDISLQALLTDLNGAIRELGRIKDDLRHFLKLDSNDYVFWLEATQAFKFRSVHLFSSPIDVSHLMRKYLFDTKDSVIMTSATLSIQKNFEYIEEQLGLSGYRDQNRLKSIMLASPFSYREQALVIIPRDFPLLKGSNFDQNYLNKLVESLAECATQTNGRMLVLFTSYRMLKQVYDPLKEALEVHKIDVLGQGVDSNNRSKLTKRFLQQPATVLLGTSSFWEGVDIPGEALLCLAIVRLPFQPPNHPLVEAKSELLIKQKKNPFMKLSIPQAVIRFKQGFGRLVRSSQDKGIVIIYDTRVIESYYGKHFLYSLPGPKIETMHTKQMVSRMADWLKGENGIETE